MFTNNTNQNDSSFPTLFDELEWREHIEITNDTGSLAETLNTQKIAFYCGFDPTAESLHLGNLAQIVFARRLQNAGHIPILVVGGATGLIGDPKPTSERSLQDKTTVEEWTAKIGSQLRQFLNFESENKAELVNNFDWFSKINVLDFLRDVGKHFRVNQMLRMEAVESRLLSEEGISFTEFTYTLLQGTDFLHLFEEKNCVLQIGGTDQMGNMLSGVNLIAKNHNAKAFAVGSHIIADATGKKFGKSEGNAVWLNPVLTSPFQLFQFLLNVDDELVFDLLRMLTFITRPEFELLGVTHWEAPHKRLAQKELAMRVTSFVHGDDEVRIAEKVSQVLFGNADLSQVEEKVVIEALKHIPVVEVSNNKTFVDALVESGEIPSRGQARTLITQGGVKLHGETVKDADAKIILIIKHGLLRVGRRKLVGLVKGE